MNPVVPLLLCCLTQAGEDCGSSADCGAGLWPATPASNPMAARMPPWPAESPRHAVPPLHTVGQVPDLPPVYKDAPQKPLGYYGPGREEPEPQGLREVLIGYFGPSDPRHPEGGPLWLAATQAVQ